MGFPWLEDVGTEVLTWPSYAVEPATKKDKAYSTIAAVVPVNGVTIDFEAGVARRHGAGNTNLSQGLDDVGEEFVRSLDLYTDTPVQANVSGDEGQSKAGAITSEMAHVSLRDCRVKTLDLKPTEPAQEPTRAVLLASTQPEMALELDGPPLRKTRVAVVEKNVFDDTPVADHAAGWQAIAWTPPAVVETELTNLADANKNRSTQINSSADMWVPVDAASSLQVQNTGSVSIGVSARAFAHDGLDYTVGPTDTAELPGWSRSSPKQVDAGENKLFDVAGALNDVGASVSKIRFDVAVTGDNATNVPFRAGFVADAQ